MKKLSENLQSISCLDNKQKQFLFKRLFFSQINGLAAWGIITSAISGWLLVYWLKPILVSSSYILQLLKDKSIDHQQLAEQAVTGASAISALFVLLVFIAIMMLSFAKKEKQYLKIIELLEDKNSKEGNNEHNY
jgi:NADH:ubiquinone oxidoreductase subunit 2 (subunit N)